MEISGYPAWQERSSTQKTRGAETASPKGLPLAESDRREEPCLVRSIYQIERQAITTGLRRANVRVEQRLDGSLAVRHGERYLPVKECAVADKPKAARPVKAAKTRRSRGRGSDWNKNFDLQKAPK